MSRAVSGVFGTTVASPPSSQSTSKSNDSSTDGSSFGDALDRAKANNTSDKAASSSQTSAKGAAPKAGKGAGGRQSPVKKAVAEQDANQTKTQKKAEPQSSADPESGLADENPDADAEQSADSSAKGQKKSSAAPLATAPQDTPSAIIQLQGTAAAQEAQPAASSLPKEDTSSKKTVKPPVATTTKAAQEGNRKPLQSDATASSPDAPAPESSDQATAEADPCNGAAKPEKSRLAIQSRDGSGTRENTLQNAPSGAVQQPALASVNAINGAAASQVAAVGPAVPPAKADRKNVDDLLLQALPPQSAATSSPDTTATDGTSDVDNSQASSGSQFADSNHPRIVSSITGRLLPSGGSMQIRLDPPELGAMQIRVEMHNGTMTASFETSNDQATRLLSHSLGDLRSALAAQGVNVEKLQVSQSPKQQQQSPSGDSQRDNSQTPQDTASQQEQQRKEMVRRMWQKLMGGADPVDLVA